MTTFPYNENNDLLLREIDAIESSTARGRADRGVSIPFSAQPWNNDGDKTPGDY